MDHSPQVAALRARAEADDRIVGLVLRGSAARGMATEHSDLDVYVVLSEEAPGWETTRTPQIDTIYVTLEQISTIPADPGDWWNRWSFTYADVLLDRGGVRAAVEAQASLTEAEAHTCLDHYLDGYINFAYRSLKSERDGRPLERHLDAAESIAWLLWCVFAFVGRVRPYNKYLTWELREHPFTDETWSAVPLLPLLQSLLASGDAAAQRRLFAVVESEARRDGRGGVVDDWGDELALLRGSPL